MLRGCPPPRIVLMRNLVARQRGLSWDLLAPAGWMNGRATLIVPLSDSPLAEAYLIVDCRAATSRARSASACSRWTSRTIACVAL